MSGANTDIVELSGNLQRALLDLWNEAPTTVLQVVTRTLARGPGCRLLVVALVPGSPFPQLEHSIRIDDLTEPLISQVVSMIMSIVGAPPATIPTTAAAAARGATMWLRAYRMRAVQEAEQRRAAAAEAAARNDPRRNWGGGTPE